MNALLVAPHADDESLFACYLALRLRARVVVCLDSGLIRFLELTDAMDVLGCEWSMIRTPEDDPNWGLVQSTIEWDAKDATTLIAPAYEDGGHEHHNRVARIVDELDHPHVVRYLTYVRGRGRSTGVEVPSSQPMRDLKLAALLCYQSQIKNPATAPWFPGGAYSDMREWIAE